MTSEIPTPRGDDVPVEVLLVEDDQRLARLTGLFLETHGLVVTSAATGPEALREAARRRYDVVLLDLNLPGLDGIEVCRELRRGSDVPILMLTARGGEPDRMRGLEVGADDYVTKPFSARELLSRVRAVVRRARGEVGAVGGTLAIGPLRLDPARERVTLGDAEIALTSYEFSLLHALAERAGRVLSRERLLDLARGLDDQALDRSIDVHISRLRQKLGDDARSPRLLRAIPGAGYVLTPIGER